MRATWYVMEDDTAGDPRDIAADENGILRHRDGRAVAYAAHGPRSRGVDVEAEMAKADEARKAAEEEAARKAAEEAGAGKSKDAKPEGGKQGYKTRESKAG